MDALTHGPEQTRDLGTRLGERLRAGDLVCLAGELGAGKTTLAIGIGRGWGATEIVNSPTFVMVNQYSRPDGARLYHVDAYRLRDASDAESIALPDILDEPGGAVMIEWPERVLAHLPPEQLWIDLGWVDDTTRRLRLKASGGRHVQLLKALAET